MWITRHPQTANSFIAPCPSRGNQPAILGPRLGDLDDIRTYMRRAERAAALIYAHFKKEFDRVPDRP